MKAASGPEPRATGEGTTHSWQPQSHRVRLKCHDPYAVLGTGILRIGNNSGYHSHYQSFFYFVCMCERVRAHLWSSNYAYAGWSEEDVQCLTLSLDGFFPGDRMSY